MKDFFVHLKRRWYIYVAVAIVIIPLLLFILDAVTKPTNEQKISMFLSCYSCNEELSVRINENLPEGIREFDLGDFSQDETFYASYFNTYGKDADLVVLSQKYSDMCSCDSYFIELEEERVKARYGDNVEFYYFEGKAYGIKVFDKETKSGIASNEIQYCKEGEEENSYLFFGKGSKHLGDFANNSNDDAALKILDMLWQN